MRRSALVIALCCVIGGISACGSDSDSESGSTGSGSGAPASTGADGTSAGSAFVAAAKSEIEKAYSGDFGKPPASSPAPPKDKTVWILACSLQAPACITYANASEDAMKKVGWSTKIVDGKLTPSVYASVVRQAIAAKVDAIELISVNCDDVPGPLKQAKAAGIKLIPLASVDCPDAPVFDGEALFKGGLSYAELLRNAIPKAQVDYIVAATDGKANMIVGNHTDNAVAKAINAGFREYVADCTECKVTYVDYGNQDLVGSKLKQKFATALVQNRDADVVVSPYDAAITLGVGPAVQAAGRDILSVASEGLSANLDLIRSGSAQQQAAPAGLPVEWAAYGTVDNLIRIFNGEDAIDQGVWIEPVDKDHNLPAKGQPVNPENLDWKSQYLKNWGV